MTVDLLYQHQETDLSQTEYVNALGAFESYHTNADYDGEIERFTTFVNDDGTFDVSLVAMWEGAVFSDASTFASNLDAEMPSFWEEITESDIEAR